MAIRHHFKKVAIFLGTAVVLFFVNNACLAYTEVYGQITVYHLNLSLSVVGTIGRDQRGVCIQMAPALAETWICTYGPAESFGLWNKVHDVLWDAYNQHRPCSIGYDETRLNIKGTYPPIQLVSC